jgi:hypothetical protein
MGDGKPYWVQGVEAALASANAAPPVVLVRPQESGVNWIAEWRGRIAGDAEDLYIAFFGNYGDPQWATVLLDGWTFEDVDVRDVAELVAQSLGAGAIIGSKRLLLWRSRQLRVKTRRREYVTAVRRPKGEPLAAWERRAAFRSQTVAARRDESESDNGTW